MKKFITTTLLSVFALTVFMQFSNDRDINTAEMQPPPPAPYIGDPATTFTQTLAEMQPPPTFKTIV